MEYRGAIVKATLPTSAKNLSQIVCGLGSMRSCSAMRLTMANSSMFAPTMYGLLDSESNTRHKKVQIGETSNKRSTQCRLRTLYTWAAS